MTYATSSDVEAFIGKPPPPDVDRLIERASELMDYLTMGRIDTSIQEHADAAKKAVCAQIEHWMWVGEAQNVAGVKGYSVGSFSVNFDKIETASVSNRAIQYLWMAGLIRRGVGRW